MDAKYLAEIKAREQAATPGPWDADTPPYVTIQKSEYVINAICAVGVCEQNIKDADFIAHARTDIPALLAEVERLKKDRDHLKAQLDMYGGDEGITSALQEAVDCRKEAAAANLEKAKLNRQIATLGKALELAEDMLTKMTPFKSKGGWHDRLIQQAQEQEAGK